MSGVLFAELAAATEDVRALSGRKDKVERLAAALRGLDVDGARGGRRATSRARRASGCSGSGGRR